MASEVEKWQGKLCRMANRYCIYVQRGDSIAHLPEQQESHRYIPVDVWGDIMNISLFRATKTEQPIIVVENATSWKALLNNYHISTILSSATPSSSCLLTNTSLVHWPFNIMCYLQVYGNVLDFFLTHSPEIADAKNVMYKSSIYPDVYIYTYISKTKKLWLVLCFLYIG